MYAYTQRVFSGHKIEFILDDRYRTINRFRSQETTANLLAEAFVLFRRKLITNQVIDKWCYFEEDMYIRPAHRAVPFKQYSRRKDKAGFVGDFKIYECENCQGCHVRSQFTKAKNELNRQILVNNTCRYFKAECKKKLLD